MAEEYLKYINEIVTTSDNKQYTITKFISEGGNGYVFEATNDKNDIFVLKVLHTTNSTKIENFKKEIKLQKSINSKYIVKCIDNGEQRFGNQRKSRPFYIMKKYDLTLEDLINQNAISPLNAFEYSIQLCEALKVLHKHVEPIIHRDLKPENILYDRKNDRVLICDFGLAHIEMNQKTINEGFVGNIDYHAPEQKIRGEAIVGTYTDIYSLGLIINVLFTKEIAQGENYKKIWEVAPYFSFMDSIVERMIKHDFNIREKDINAVLIDLEKHDMEYEVESSFFNVMFKDKGLTSQSLSELINLFSLLKYSIKNKMNWDEINLNYFCDYHFSCDETLKNSILITRYYERIKEKFEYEGNAYNGSNIPYNSIDITIEENKNNFIDFANMIDSLLTYDELKNTKNRIKKYYLSLSDYHAKEIIENFKKIDEEVVYHCIDAPILCIAQYISQCFSIFNKMNYEITSSVRFDKYEKTDVIDKRQFYYDKNKKLKDLAAYITSKIAGMTYSIRDGKIEISFENMNQEEEFEQFITNLADSVNDGDVRKDDLFDIIQEDNSVGFKKLYTLDKADASSVLALLEKCN